MENINGLVSSLVYIFIVLGLATAVAKYSRGASESSRKLVHILVGNWVFLTPLFVDLWAVVLVPFSFIIINSLSMKYKLIAAMERNDDSYGTVYYAISLFVLSAAGFILKWPRLPYFGILIMAYGDGLAAVIGQKYGHLKPFPFAPKKSLAGTLTVAVVSFIVTFSVLFFMQDNGLTAEPGLLLILFVALATAIVSAAIELLGEKGCDNISLPIGSALFAELAIRYAGIGFFLYIGISILILLVAYRKRSITGAGMVAALLTAMTLFSFGGLWIGSSLLVFFVLGSAVSKIKSEPKKRAESLQEGTEARSWQQVLANSLPAAVLLWLYYIFPSTEIFLFLAFTVFSAAAADTFSSEIGMLSKGRVFNILNGKVIPNGVSGGVSALGLAAGVAGSLILSLLCLPQFGWRGFIYATVLGLSGSIVDSILGASIQRKYCNLKGHLQDKAEHINDKPVKGFKMISNNAINLITLMIVPTIGYFILK